MITDIRKADNPENLPGMMAIPLEIENGQLETKKSRTPREVRLCGNKRIIGLISTS